jgi:hypothetical protein
MSVLTAVAWLVGERRKVFRGEGQGQGDNSNSNNSHDVVAGAESTVEFEESSTLQTVPQHPPGTATGTAIEVELVRKNEVASL